MKPIKKHFERYISASNNSCFILSLFLVKIFPMFDIAVSAAVHSFKWPYGKYPLLQHGFLVVAICWRLVALCRNVILCDVELFPNRISKENFVLSSAGFEYYSQGIQDTALVYVLRHITPVWEHLLGQIGAFLKSSAPQLSVEHKTSWIVYRHHWENRIWREQT